jgi:hypothetical protein
MIRKSGNRFSEKIMLKQRDEIMIRSSRAALNQMLWNPINALTLAKQYPKIM